MNAPDREMRIADYIGGEMGAEERRRFEAEVAADAGLAEEVATLTAARDAMQRLGGVTRVTHAEPARPRRRVGMTLLRYAAVIALAFGSGYAVAQRSSPPDPPSGTTPVAVEQTQWTDRVAREYGRTEHTGLSRSLLAIAQASRSAPSGGDG